MSPIGAGSYPQIDRRRSHLKQVRDGCVQKSIPIKIIAGRTRSIKAGHRVGSIHKPGVVTIQIIFEIQLQALRIEVQLAEVVIAKPTLIEGQARREIPAGIGNERRADSAVPEKIAMIAIADKQGIVRVVKRLAGGEGKHLRPWLA